MGMNLEMIKAKVSKLKDIYRKFDQKANEAKKEQACEKGCGFCCKEAGSIDITTLEGFAIRDAMKALPRSRQKSLTKSFQQEIKKREKGIVVPCPFLMKNNACMIYEDRPFSCRRIYSTHVCTRQNPPMVSRQVMEDAKLTIKALQELDITGYSGHMSYILYMLSTPEFLDTYLKGECKPEEIMVFGKAHKIIINKMVV
ncbi:Putative zinc-or iron-chelating domain-containing protein [Desulfocicer vacuolatum DSM 3385]|uniref:Putative zinc-or iron-chelating domain-containing protein n=2 Tax=Desulfocicer vacuolatum TaxID=2298 RepID=A0A1W2A4W5_9BACT|nr:Putative zinc-or iron-chelating domain-containing protein [Desulfocicer vacuolatum DSM 3385]